MQIAIQAHRSVTLGMRFDFLGIGDVLHPINEDIRSRIAPRKGPELLYGNVSREVLDLGVEVPSIENA